MVVVGEVAVLSTAYATKKKGTDFLNENSEIESTLRRVNVIRGYECNSLAGGTRSRDGTRGGEDPG